MIVLATIVIVAIIAGTLAFCKVFEEIESLDRAVRRLDDEMPGDLDDQIHPDLSRDTGLGFIIKENPAGVFKVVRGNYAKIDGVYEYVFTEINAYEERTIIDYNDLYTNSWAAQLVCDIMNLESVVDLDSKLEKKKNESVRTTRKR